MDPRSRDFVKIGGQALPARAARRRLDPRALPGVDFAAVADEAHTPRPRARPRARSRRARARSQHARARRRDAEGVRGGAGRGAPPPRPRTDPAVPRRRAAHEGARRDRVRRRARRARRADAAPDEGRAGRRARRDAARHAPPRLRLRARRRTARTRSSTRGCSTRRTRRRPTRRAACRCAASASRSSARSRSTIEGKDPDRRGRAATSSTASPRGSSQHELDHLDGVLIIDRTDAEHRKEALGALRPQPDPALGAHGSPRRRRDGSVRRGRPRAPRGAHEIAYLLTRPDAPRGRGRKLAPTATKEVAERLGIPVHQPEKPALPDEPVDDDRDLRLRAARPASRCSTRRSGSTSIRRCCRAGAAPRPSSARSSPATRRPA